MLLSVKKKKKNLLLETKAQPFTEAPFWKATETESDLTTELCQALGCSGR